MTVFAVLTAGIIAAVTLPAVCARPAWRVRGLVSTSVVFAGLAVGMAGYVLSEDDYLNDGRSRWAVYNAQENTVVAIAAARLTGALAVASVARRWPAWMVSFVGVVAVVTTYAARAQMTN